MSTNLGVQELRDLRLVNEGLQRKAQSWLAERDKLHKLVDELRYSILADAYGCVLAKMPIPWV